MVREGRHPGRGSLPTLRGFLRAITVGLLVAPLAVPWLANATPTVAADGTNGIAGVAGPYGALLVERPGSWRELELTPSRGDADIRANVRADKAATGRGQSVFVIARRTGPRTEYRARLGFSPDGGVNLAVVRLVNGYRRVISPLARVPNVAHGAGRYVAVRVRILGTQPARLGVKVWQAGLPEPSGWTRVVADDAAQLAGKGWYGLRFAVSASATNAPVRYLYDRVSVTAPPTAPFGDPGPLPSPDPSPTPVETPTPSSDPSPLATPTPTATPTATPEDSPTPTPPATPTPTSPSTPTPTPVATPSPTPAATPTPTPSLPANALVVSVDGSDTAAGTAADPWRTLQKAADSAPPGATILVRAGTYPGFTMRRSGTSTAPITFAAYPGDEPVIDGGSAVAYTVRLVGVRHVNLVGLTITGGYAERHAGGGVSIESSAYVTVRDSILRDNKAFGVRSAASTDVLIDSNDITRNAVGVHVTGYSAGTVVSNNLIHENTRMMVNTADIPNDDVGAEGVAIVRSHGRVVIRGNTIWGNRSPSYDYGYDGGAFSIYASSDWTITDNVTYDNRNVLETGTDSNMTPCDNNAFTRNLNFGATTVDRTVGMVLRCASNTLVANNTFYGMQWFVFAISHNRPGWGGSIEGLRIVNNVISASAKVYGIDTEMPASVVIDNNIVERSGTGHIATVYGLGGTTSWATFRSWTGYEQRGIAANPRFVDPAANDFRLGSDSPGVDAGMHVPGVTDAFAGQAPDLGYREGR